MGLRAASTMVALAFLSRSIPTVWVEIEDSISADIASTGLSICSDISFFYFGHYVVVAEDVFDVLAAVVDFPSESCVWDGSVAAEGLECAGTDVQELHDVLAVEEFLEVDGWFIVHCCSSFRIVRLRGLRQR